MTDGNGKDYTPIYFRWLVEEQKNPGIMFVVEQFGANQWTAYGRVFNYWELNFIEPIDDD